MGGRALVQQTRKVVRRVVAPIMGTLKKTEPGKVVPAASMGTPRETARRVLLATIMGILKRTEPRATSMGTPREKARRALLATSMATLRETARVLASLRRIFKNWGAPR